MEFAGCANDGAFGPSVHGCRGDFDFTIRFEKIFFSLIPSSVLIAIALPRLITLFRRSDIVRGTWYRYVKLLAILILAVLQLALVGISANAKRMAGLFIASAVLDFLATLAAASLSFWEHSRSPRPSVLLNGYLPLLVLFDAAQARSMWLVSHNRHDFTFVKLFTAGAAVRTILVILESKGKQRWLQWDKSIHSPEEFSGIYSLGTYSWLSSLLLVGYKKVMDMSDLYALDFNMSTHYLAHYRSSLKTRDFKGKKHVFARSLFSSLAVPFLTPVAPRIATLAFSLCQPLLIESLIKYLDNPEGRSDNVGYGLIGATVLVYFGLPISRALYNYYVSRALYMTRGVLVTTIYERTTQAPSTAGDDAAALTLMSTDVERIRVGLNFAHDIWAIPIQVGISCWLLYRQLGLAFLAPLVVMLVCVGASGILVRWLSPLQTKWMELVEKRVGKTSNAIANMKNIKISGLTESVRDAIQDMRVNEIKAGNKFRGIDLIITGFGFTPGQMSAMFTFAVTSKAVDVSSIFSSVAYLALLAGPLNNLIQSAPEVVAALACTQRIQAFLDKDTRKDFRKFSESSDEKEGSTDGSSKSASFKLSDVSYGWEKDKFIVKDVTASFIPGLNIVIGPVASGKSTLCKALLGEVTYAKGDTIANVEASKIGFCDQVPFLLNSTIQQNIIGFSPLDEARYAEVLEAAMLNPDLLILPQGDQTKIGSNGIALSGGQKQRVSIARALYQNFELFVFDDILSGLDADTEQNVFNRVFGPNGILKQRGATTVLCTHSVRHLPDADHVVALSVDGRLVEEGTFTDLMANNKYVHSLGIQAKTADTSSNDSSESTDENDNKEDSSATAAKASKKAELKPQDKERIARTMGDSQVFLHYFKSIGAFWLAMFFLSGIIDGFFWNFPNVWLKYWAADLGPNPTHSRAFYMGIYSFLSIGCVIFIVIEIGIGLLIITKISGIALHKNAIETLCSAPLSFFTKTDVGVVTNLFSQDMTLVDGELPMAFLNSVAMLWIVIGGAAVSATASPYVLIAYPFICVAVFFLQRFYLRTSRQLRLLDLEAKSPLYTNFIDTIKGVATYRAFGWTEAAIEQNNVFLDTSQRPAYFLNMVQRWLYTILDILIAIIALLIVILSTQLNSNSGFAGASMVSIISFGGFLGAFVLNYTMLETSLGAVNRLKTFDEKTTSEQLPGEDAAPPPSWPEKGRIVIENLSASYTDDQSTSEQESDKSGEKENSHSLALRQLSLVIEAGQKVAICGRTGSGKSSTVLVLLRLLDALKSSEYTMTIDGQPLDKVDRTVLRKRLIAVPQEPVFLPDGTSFQTNLDPSHVATKEECQSALEAVDLWKYVEEKGGLDEGMVSDALSQGQKQLYSLGRAILRRRMRARLLASDVGEAYLDPTSEKSVVQTSTTPPNDGGVLILDEYSSSLDVDTDKTMQAIIRREFEGYTIVMVSHRLEMVMGFDKVVVLDAGQVVEDGVPAELVKQEGSRFRELWMIGKTE